MDINSSFIDTVVGQETTPILNSSAAAIIHVSPVDPDTEIVPEPNQSNFNIEDTSTDTPPPSQASPPSAEKLRKRHHVLPAGSDNKVVNVINSTKIIIKGINVNAAAVAAARVEAADRVSSSPPPPQLHAHDEFPEELAVADLSVADQSVADQSIADTTDTVDENAENQSFASDEQIEEHSQITPTTPTLRTSTPKINRECMLLQRTVNESKMLTEYMNDSESRARKAKRGSAVAQRQIADEVLSDNESAVSSRGGGGSRAADRSRSRSRSRNQSPGSSDGKGPRRSNMRSQNAEFSAKHQKFLMGIQQHHQQESDASENTDHELDGSSSVMLMDVEAPGGDGDQTNVVHTAPQAGSDYFCWICRRGRTTLACTTCKRSVHPECLKSKHVPVTEEAKSKWRCVECFSADPVETEGIASKRPKAKYTKDELCTMLKFAVKRCQQVNTYKTVDFPTNSYNIVNEMNLAILDARINAKVYATTSAFTSDVKWIVHNCVVSIYRNAKLLNAAKNILKTAKQEMYDIETCPECYYNANTRKHDWFEEVCMRPHILLWAKLKGFPFWPAKAMGTNAALVDVRFFGEHDRAWVPIRDCYLFSKEDPNPPNYKYKRNSIVESMKEVDAYIKKITLKFGSFVYAPHKVTYNPEIEDDQLEILIPNIRPYLTPHTSARSDLTFKIVKTADNNMSIVKKSDSTPTLVNVKTSDSNVSIVKKSESEPAAAIDSFSSTSSNACTSTPSQSKNENNMVDAKKEEELIQKASVSKNCNMNPRVLVAKDNTMQRYQVMNRESDDESSDSPRHTEDGKVKAVILKRKSMGPSSRKRIRSPSDETLDEKKKPRKIALDLVLSDVNTSNPTDCTEDLVATETEEKIELAASSSPPKENISPQKEATESSVETRTQSANVLVVPSDDATMFVPMMEIKNEIVDEEEQITLSSSRSSLNVTGLSNVSADVKLEPMSEDEQLDGDDILTETAKTQLPRVTIEITTPKETTITPRGNITVKDMAKLKNPPSLTFRKHPEQQPKSAQQYTLLKNVFKRAKTKDPNATKSAVNNRSNVTAHQPSNFNSMVYIPMGDVQQFTGTEALVSKPKDQVTNNKNYLNNLRNISVSQPPPLTSVSPVSSTNKTNVTNSPQSTFQLYQSPRVIPSQTPTMNYITSSCPPPLVASLSTGQTIQTNTGPSVVIQQVSTPVGAAPPRPASPGSHFLGDMIPDNLARAVTDTLARGTPPRLVAKPTGALRSDGVSLAHNMDAGPVSKMLIDNSHKLADFFRSVIEDTLADMSGSTTNAPGSSLEARNKLLQLENERLRSEHAAEIEKLRTNTDQILREMQRSLENEKTRLVAETRQQCVAERIRSVEETKKKQWCVQCGKEAQFYCCWNTSYCDYPCQQQHWTRHMPKCAQQTEHHNGLMYANPAVAVDKNTVNATAAVDKSSTAPAKSTFKVVQNHKTPAGNKSKTAAQQRNNAAAVHAQQQRVISLQQLPIQPSPTAFTLINRPVNCVMVSTATTKTNIPHNTVVNTYAASPGNGGSLLISSATSMAGNDHIIRVVTNNK